MLTSSSLLVSLWLAASSLGQQVGNLTAESQPRLPYQECTRSGCTTRSAGAVSLDANWRWLHVVGNYTNCYTGNAWNSSACTGNAECASRCALEGANYRETYGITTSGNALTLKFVTRGENTNVGSRVYLMESESKYKMFNVLNKEFTFDVDVSKLPCGLNGALYFIQMDEDGGMSRHSGNKAGAKYGTGYCDSQCPRDIKFIDGQANAEGWSAGADENQGLGKYGTCCGEMDIWEANSISTAYTPHPCTTQNDGGQQRCEGQDCNVPDRYGGLCDPDGCDFNSYRLGDRTYYGPGKTVDTNKKMTVVTQFITDNNSTTGTLVEIRRLYVQDGRVIPNSKVNFPGLLDPTDSITEDFCNKGKAAFGDATAFQKHGGLAHMGRSLAKGHVLALSIWDDHAAQMLWLDSEAYPIDSDKNKPGIARGTCATDSGKPDEVRADHPDAQVIFSNIKLGEIGSTFSGTPITLPQAPLPPGYNPPSNPGQPGTTTTTTTTSTTPTTTNPAPGATQTRYGQCGGVGYSGPTQCAAGTTCTAINQFYSQCV